tara:strand:- start:22895 stop:23971 length:1077 start_codon:yes stop_codon:yes gene_type:complete
MKDIFKNLEPLKNEKLIVEPLKASHLSMLALSEYTKRLGWIQIMLLKTWLSEAEGKLQGILPTRQPRCLVALENDELLAVIVLQPNNRKGSSWSISLPELIKEPSYSTLNDVRLKLFQQSFEIDNNVANSWLIRCSSQDQNNLSLLRELGFQPLKALKKFKYGSNLINNTNIKEKGELLSNLSWQTLNKKNAHSLSRLRKSSDSVHLRELLDHQSIDLLDRNEPKNGLLTVNNNSSNITAILGLVSPICPNDLFTLELIRDIAWDERLIESIPIVIFDLVKKYPHIFVETSVEDIQSIKLLTQNGWTEECEEILLGRSLWKRKGTNKLNLGNASLEALLGQLKTNQPPLPSPINNRFF